MAKWENQSGDLEVEWVQGSGFGELVMRNKANHTRETRRMDVAALKELHEVLGVAIQELSK